MLELWIRTNLTVLDSSELLPFCPRKETPASSTNQYCIKDYNLSLTGQNCICIETERVVWLSVEIEEL